MEDERWLMMGVLDHLQKAVKAGQLEEKPLQEAIFAISNAYALNMHNNVTRERYPLDNLSLVDIFKAGRAQLLPTTSPAGAPETQSRAMPSAPASSSKAPAQDASASSGRATATDDDGFAKFVARLKNTTNLFKGVEEGSAEYERRMTRAREKFDAKRSEKKSRATGARSSAPRPATAAEKERAEGLKKEGNVLLKAKKYEEALELYTQCIELDDRNAVYFSNRAAAKIMLSRFSEAVDDCKRAISLDGKFIRPREKLATAYRSLGMAQKEIDALTGALRLAPYNEAFQEQLRVAKRKIAAANGDPEGTSNLPGGVESLMNGMPNMNPDTLNHMAQAMGLNLPSGAADSFLNSGGMDQIGNMIRDNPNMVQQAMQAMMGGGFTGIGTPAAPGTRGEDIRPAGPITSNDNMPYP